jgi:WD40 repeat protein
MKTKKPRLILLAIIFFLLMACTVFQSDQKYNGVPVTSVQLSDLDSEGYLKIGLGRVYSTKYSPDSKKLAIATSNGVLLYDTISYNLLKRFPDSFVDNLEWSPDGFKLAYNSGEDIKLIDLQSEKVADLEEQGIWLVGDEMSWSPDGKMLASIDSTDINGSVYIWDTSGKLLHKIIYPEKRAFGRYIYSKGVAWSPDGKYLSVPYGFVNISASDKPSDIVIWDMSNKTPTVYKQWVISNIFMGGLEWTPDGKYLILGGNPLTIFNAEDGSVINKIDTQNASRFAMSLNGNQLLIPSGMSATNLPDGNQLVNPSGKTEISVASYTVPELIKTHEYKGRIYSPETVDISSDENFVVAGDSFIDGFDVWNYQDQEIVKSVLLDSHWNDDVKFSPDSKYFALLGRDNIIRLYNTENGGLIQTSTTGLPDEFSWARNMTRKHYAPVLSPDRKWLSSIGPTPCDAFFCTNDVYELSVQSYDTNEILVLQRKVASKNRVT